MDLTSAISGDNDRWHGKTKRFTNREAEKALRSAGVLRDRGSQERLNGLDKGVPAAFPVEPAAAIQLQILYRVDPQHKKERTFILFHNLRAGGQDTVSSKYRHVSEKIPSRIPSFVAGWPWSHREGCR